MTGKDTQDLPSGSDLISPFLNFSRAKQIKGIKKGDSDVGLLRQVATR